MWEMWMMSFCSEYVHWSIPAMLYLLVWLSFKPGPWELISCFHVFLYICSNVYVSSLSDVSGVVILKDFSCVSLYFPLFLFVRVSHKHLSAKGLSPPSSPLFPNKKKTYFIPKQNSVYPKPLNICSWYVTVNTILELIHCTSCLHETV